MGVYIPNMDKPKTAFECSTKINPEERMCIYTGKVFEETLSLLLDHPCDDCPLIEIDEPKVGKWIDHKEIIHTDPEIWGYSQECSLCGFTLGAKEYNYCPNCGAKMERRTDET